jgi:hypothetical protein
MTDVARSSCSRGTSLASAAICTVVAKFTVRIHGTFTTVIACAILGVCTGADAVATVVADVPICASSSCRAIPNAAICTVVAEFTVRVHGTCATVVANIVLGISTATDTVAAIMTDAPTSGRCALSRRGRLICRSRCCSSAAICTVVTKFTVRIHGTFTTVITCAIVGVLTGADAVATILADVTGRSRRRCLSRGKRRWVVALATVLAVVAEFTVRVHGADTAVITNTVLGIRTITDTVATVVADFSCSCRHSRRWSRRVW